MRRHEWRLSGEQHANFMAYLADYPVLRALCEASALLAHSSLQITRKHYRLKGQMVVPAAGFMLPKR